FGESKLGARPEAAESFGQARRLKSSASAELRRKALVKKWKAVAEEDGQIAYVLKQFNNKAWFGRLFPFPAFENAHRTTNSTAQANRWFRKRQKTHYRCRKEHTVRR